MSSGRGRARRRTRVADDRGLEQAIDLRGDRGRRGRRRAFGNEPEHRHAVAPRAGSDTAGDRKSLRVGVPKTEIPWGRRGHLRPERVHKGEQLRHGAKAAGDRAPPRRAAAERPNLPGGLVEQRDLRLPEAIDRLLPIADHEDRRRRVGRPFALAPGLDEELDEPPLLAARVLKLVDEHVVIAGLELQSAARELLLAREQRDGPIEHAGKVEERVLGEERLIGARRDNQDAQQAAREQAVDAGIESIEHAFHQRRQRPNGGIVPAPDLGGCKEWLVFLRRHRARRVVVADETYSRSRLFELPDPGGVGRGQAVEPGQIRGQPTEVRRADRTVTQDRPRGRRRQHRPHVVKKGGRDRLGRRHPRVPADERRDGGQQDVTAIEEADSRASRNVVGGSRRAAAGRRHPRPRGPRTARNVRASASAEKRAISVSSAISNAGSTPASSGNSRRRPKQNASMVETWMSATRSVSARQRGRNDRSARARASRVASTRSRISAAALRVNVIARMWRGSTPASRSRTNRSTSTRVLPVPAEASSTT